MKKGLIIIVTDGNPGGGKNELIRLLMLDPWFAEFGCSVAEAAETVTLASGITREEKDGWPPEMWDAFQKVIAEWTIFSVARAVHLAILQGKKVLVTNRHIGSGGAYTRKGLEGLRALTGLDFAEMIDGIDHVIVPGPPPERFYERHEIGNPKGFRFEHYERACELGVLARQAYIELGFVPGETLHAIPGGDDFNVKAALFIAKARELAGADR